MFIVALNVIIIAIILGIAGFLSLIAVTLIIISLVRRHKAKKAGRKTHPVGLVIGIIMLVAPWLFVAWFFIYVDFSEKEKNYQAPSSIRDAAYEAIVDKDAEGLYELMAQTVIEDQDLTVNDIEAFLELIDDVDEGDYEVDTSIQTGRYLVPGGGNKRPKSDTQAFYTFVMRDLWGTDQSVYFAAVYEDSEDPDNVGLHIIVFNNGEEGTDRPMVGRPETWAGYVTPEIEAERESLMEEYENG
ncbi:MAG: hypothetical protein IJ757_07475 [Clostridiales bacterium]|nr:hypothetical protein [Clostridiales bacterium]